MYRRRCRECPTVITNELLGQLLKDVAAHEHSSWSREDDKRELPVQFNSVPMEPWTTAIRTRNKDDWR